MFKKLKRLKKPQISFNVEGQNGTYKTLAIACLFASRAGEPCISCNGISAQFLLTNKHISKEALGLQEAEEINPSKNYKINRIDIVIYPLS